MDEERELRQAAPARGACATPPLRLASGGASPSPHLPGLSLTLSSVRSCSQEWRLGLVGASPSGPRCWALEQWRASTTYPTATIKVAYVVELHNVLGLANMLNSGGVAISEGTQWRPGCDGGASARRTPPPRRRASTWMPYGKPSAAHHFVVSGRVCFCVCGRRHGGGSGGGYLRWLEAAAVEAAAAAARRRGAGQHWCPARLRRSEKRSVERALCATVL